MHFLWKYGSLFCLVFWSLIILHIQVLLFRSYAQGKETPVRQSTCPFKAAKLFFGQPTAVITNSLFAIGKINSIRNIAASGLVAHIDPNTWKRFQHLHDGPNRDSPFRIHSPSCNYGSDSSYPHCYFTGVTLKATKQEDQAEPITIDGELKRKHGHNLDALEVVVLGLSHHNSKVDLREKLAVPEERWNEVSQQLTKFPSIAEASVLSTCNRFEIYLAGSNQYEIIRDVIQFLTESSNNSVDTFTLRKNLFMLSGEDAIWHLLRVSAGLDSLIVGEGQILAQVKKCYEHGISSTPAPAGKVLSRLLNSAVAAGKRVRTETGISKGAVSISSAAAEFSAMRLQEDCDIKELPEASISIIGAGKMTRLLLTHLESQGVRNVTILNRSMGKIVEIQNDFPNLSIEGRSMDTLWDTIREQDICFTATSSVLPIITPEPLNNALKTRPKKSNLQIIDISVPRNVDPLCAEHSRVKSYNVDDLKSVVERNTAKRRREIIEAENILRDELTKFRLWQQSLGAIPTIAKLQEKAETLRKEEMLKAAKKLSSLTTKDLEVVEKITKGIVAKLLHGPMSHLRQQTEGDATRAAIEQVQLAFQLQA
jgi:glutamyl-tRNA reductase